MITIKNNEPQTRSIIPGLGWLAAFWSYQINHSILWAILHFILGPIYLAYRVANFLPR